jgi:squalene monooxygenase
VVIAGGGFAGLVSAAACAARGMNVLVLEARSRPLSVFRGELLHPPAVRALTELDLAGALYAAGAARIAGFAAFACRESEPILLPYPHGEGLAIGHEAMLSAFRLRLESLSNVKVARGVRVVDVLRASGRVVGFRSQDGQAHRAEIAVAADGRHSAIRGLLGIPSQASLLSYTIALAADGDRLPYPDHGHVFLGAPGPILAYPYGDRRTRLCVDVPLGAPHGRQALREYVERAFVPHLPEPLRNAAFLASKPGAMELCANHSMFSARCAVHGAVLVGDAAGCSHPLTATGMTTALHDAMILAACLSDGGSIEARVRSYQRRRYQFARVRELFAQALYDVFRADSPGARALCDGVFRYWAAGERRRTLSMKILSGEESGVTRFLVEYAKVVVPSALCLCGAALRSGRPEGLRPIRSMLSTLGTGFDAVFEQVSAALKRELLPLPADGSSKDAAREPAIDLCHQSRGQLV